MSQATTRESACALDAGFPGPLPGSPGRRLYAFCVLPAGVLPAPMAAVEVVSVADDRLALLAGSPAGSLEDEETLLAWVETHAGVVEGAWEKASGVVPLRFGTVFGGATFEEARDLAARWLAMERDRLLAVMQRISGRQEYGIELSYRPNTLSDRLIGQDADLRRAQEQCERASPGLAFLLRQRLQGLLDRRTRDFLAGAAEETLAAARRHSTAVRMDRIPARNQVRDPVLLKASCLVESGRAEDFAAALDLALDPALGLRLTGPWPPYSFVDS